LETSTVVRELWQESVVKQRQGETRVEGGSMAPTIQRGDTVRFETIERAGRIVRGDILVIDMGSETVVHRVIGLMSSGGVRYLRHKGDASLISDLVPADCVVGRVVAILPANGGTIKVDRRRVWLVNWFVDGTYRVTIRVLRKIQRRAAKASLRTSDAEQGRGL
jgi:signal peptidase I